LLQLFIAPIHILCDFYASVHTFATSSCYHIYEKTIEGGYTVPRSNDTPKDAIELGIVPASMTLECENISIDVLLYNLHSQAGAFKPESFEVHDHTVVELFIIEQGTLKIHTDSDIELKSGEMLLIRPRSPHQIIGYSDDIVRFSIRFSMNSDGKVIDRSIPPYFKSNFTESQKKVIFRLLDELRSSITDTVSTMEMYRIKARFGIILSYVLEQVLYFDAHSKVDSDNPINLYTKIENYLYLNYGQQLTLESLAAHLSYSRTQMRRILENCYGMPFTKKLREIRLTAAKKHLAEGNMSIDEIAEKCGYETRQGFESMFLKYIGVTPNQYRKKHR